VDAVLCRTGTQHGDKHIHLLDVLFRDAAYCGHRALLQWLATKGL
jgi:hypothetical protein